MNSWKRLIPGGAAIRNVAVLSSGAVVAKIATVAASPVLSRLYSPADYGVLGTYAALATVLGVTAALRYDLALVLPDTDDEAMSLLAAGTASVVLICLVALGVASGAGGVLSVWLQAPDLRGVLWLLPVSVAAVGTWSLLVGWRTRQKQFPVVARGNALRSTGTVLGQIGAGLRDLSSVGLVGGLVLGQTAGAIVLSRHLIKDGTVSRLRGVSFAQLWSAARKYRDFPMYSVPQAVLNAFSNLLPVLVLGKFFGPLVVGSYWFTYRLLQLPADLIAESVRNVYFQRAAELKKDRKSVLPSLFRATGLLGIAGVVPAVVVAISGASLFGWIFGSEWQAAGTYAAWLVVHSFLTFICAPAVVLIHTFRFQGPFLAFEVVTVVANTLALIAGAVAGSAVVAIAAYAVVGALMRVILILCTVLFVHRHEARERLPVDAL